MVKAPEREQICACGHSESDHYEYICNGHPQSRCKSCDPTNRFEFNGAVDVAFVSGSYIEAMSRAADHGFTPAEATP